VYFNIGSLFQSNAFSAGISVTDTNYQFVLSQADGALRFAYTDLTPTNYMNFLRDTNESGKLAWETATPPPTLATIPSTGLTLSPSFIGGIATNNGGILLVEAWTNTTQPLVLTIYHGTNQIAQTSLPLSITGVEQMFRSKTILLNPDSNSMPDRLTDADVPNEPDTTDMNFILVHGYNVNPQEARGNFADIYKRLYWSGSHAKFYGVTWEGYDTQGDLIPGLTADYHSNVFNAFNTAPLLNSFLNGLSGTNVVAAHSLGNMLVLATLNDYSNQEINTYFMLDAAVPLEAVEGIGTNQSLYMTHSSWTDGAQSEYGASYGTNLWASYWHSLFSTNDYRRQLTWSGRLSNLQNADVYNFYSSGEEVLRTYPTRPTPSFTGIATAGSLGELWDGIPISSYAWTWQELLKGE
ncbi:MAG: alpha/beta hydrolase, partial [Verrucomicrobiota bacterium]